jgi:hypothetical protein
MSQIPPTARLLSLLTLGAVLLTGCATLDRYDRNDRNDRYERGPRSYPRSARVESRGGEPYYRMCHNDRDTRTVRERDVRSHLRHGDDFGACRDDRYRDRDRDDRRGRRDRDDDRDDRRYRDRYREGPRSYPRSARERTRNGQTRYRMCNNDRNDRTYPVSAVRAHLDHGDRFGSCRDRGGRGRGRGRGRN